MSAMMTGREWVALRRSKMSVDGRRGQTVYVFWRHWRAPDLWHGVQWAHNKWLGRDYVASRRRSS